jgi:hypothetical protein
VRAGSDGRGGHGGLIFTRCTELIIPNPAIAYRHRWLPDQFPGLISIATGVTDEPAAAS